MKTIILLSGGMDSAVLAYHLKTEGHELHALSLNYGQSHIRELHCAAFIASETCKTYECLEIPPFFAESALTGGRGSVEVPARNLVFLSIAYAYAASLKADSVAIGVVRNDADRFPDCRPSFMWEFYETASAALGHKDVPLLRTPFILKTKNEVAQIGRALGVPFDRTWSCYAGEMEPCGKCSACVEREGALG